MMLSEHKVFCSAQPCKRLSEGNLEIERPDGAVELWPMCARHAEFIEQESRRTGIDPVTLIEEQVVFVDDIAKQHRFIIDDITKQSGPYRIIGE